MILANPVTGARVVLHDDEQASAWRKLGFREDRPAPEPNPPARRGRAKKTTE